MAIKLGTTPGSIRRPPPKLGEHTETILSELGFDARKVAELRALGAI
jgi:alpha-methylacyl-CoA racemase